MYTSFKSVNILKATFLSKYKKIYAMHFLILLILNISNKDISKSDVTLVLKDISVNIL